MVNERGASMGRKVNLISIDDSYAPTEGGADTTVAKATRSR